MSCRFYLKVNLKILRATLFDERLSDENYHSNELNTCLSPKLKSADNVYDREERLNTSHILTEQFVSPVKAKYIGLTFSL